MGSLKPAKKAAPPPPPEPEVEEEAPAAPTPSVQPNGLPAGVDIAALLGQLQGGAAAPAPAPAAPEPEPAAEGGDDMASLLSGLGLV